MRTTSRLLASLSHSTSNYLTPYAPTGLTGISTHPHPRPQLLYIYTSTLAKLARLPNDSVYRQSTEALTKHRLSIIESEVPAGFDAWQAHIANDVLPRLEKKQMRALGDIKQLSVGGKPYLFQQYEKREQDDRVEEWGGQTFVGDVGEGVVYGQDQVDKGRKIASLMNEARNEELAKEEAIENEPALTRDQVGRLEEKLAGGLIEEVIMVAQREHDLVDVMLENKVWEELEEKPEPGQWDYFTRDSNVLSTQAP